MSIRWAWERLSWDSSVRPNGARPSRAAWPRRRLGCAAGRGCDRSAPPGTERRRRRRAPLRLGRPHAPVGALEPCVLTLGSPGRPAAACALRLTRPLERRARARARTGDRSSRDRGRSVREAAIGAVVAGATAAALFLPFLLGGHFHMFSLQWQVHPPAPISLVVATGTAHGWPLRLARHVRGRGRCRRRPALAGLAARALGSAACDRLRTAAARPAPADVLLRRTQGAALRRRGGRHLLAVVSRGVRANSGAPVAVGVRLATNPGAR